MHCSQFFLLLTNPAILLLFSVSREQKMLGFFLQVLKPIKWHDLLEGKNGHNVFQRFILAKKYLGVRGNLNPEISLANSAATWRDLGFITNHIISFRFKIKLWLWCKFKKKKLFIEILNKTLKKQNPQTFYEVKLSGISLSGQRLCKEVEFPACLWKGKPIKLICLFF